MDDLEGKVVKLNTQEGFCFIQYDPLNDDDNDELYYKLGKGDELHENMSVKFNRIADSQIDGGYKAINVKKK